MIMDSVNITDLRNLSAVKIVCNPSNSYPYWSFGALLCPVVNYSQAVSVFVSAYTMVAISIDRYAAIMWPLKPRLSKKFTIFIICMVWIIAALTGLPIPILSKLSRPDVWYELCDRYLCREDWSQIGEQYERMYTVALMLLQYIIPLTVLLFTYASIGIVIWCHRIPGEAENSRDERIAKSKRKMVKMMIMVVFVFTLCWLPINILWITAETISENFKPYLWFSSHWLAMSHACYNPIIYCYMNSRFRNGFLQAFATIICCRQWVLTLMIRPRSSTGFPLTSVEASDSTLLHRNNTSTTYISMRRKNGPRVSTHNHFPVRSVSLSRNANNNQQSEHLIRRVRRSSIVEDEM